MAGTEGWQLVNLKSSDTVYTATQTKKLLAGNQTFSGAVGELPRYAKGKKGVKVAGSNSYVYYTNSKGKKKSVSDLRDEWDDRIQVLDDYKEIYNWSDAYYKKRYTAWYNAYAKAIKKVKSKGKLSGSQRRALQKLNTESRETIASDLIESTIGAVGYTGDTASAINTLDAQKRKRNITQDEYNDYIKEIYENAIDYEIEMYEAGKTSWSKLLASAEDYWEQVGEDSEEYYEKLEKLRESAEQADQNRLDYASTYVSYQIDLLNQKKEQADLEQDIVDAENELAKAQNTMVYTFKDGKWVYDVDPDAIKDAQEALDDLKGDEIDQEIAKWEAVQDALDLAGTESDLRDAGALVGEGFIETLKSYGTDVTAWSNMATGLYDSIFALEQADSATLRQLLEGREYASGTLSASGGLSLVGEHGAELVNLNKGATVFTSAMSANLMQWGQYSPAQFEAATSGGTNQVFNISGITLPNVKDANSFIKEIQLLPNKAIQTSARR